MKTIRIDGKDYEVGSDAHFEKIESMHAAALATEKTRADKAEGERDTFKKDADESKTKLEEANDPKRLDGLVKARMELVVNAARIVGKDFKHDGKSDLAVMIETIKHDDKDFDAKDKSEDYVRGRFEAATSSTRRHDEGGKGIGAVRSVAKTVTREDRKDGEGDDPPIDRQDAEAARVRMLDHNQNAAAQPLRFSQTS